jgi:tetratricopeptide (TPR) repeat protein
VPNNQPDRIEISDAAKRKAEVFFQHARANAEKGSYEYAITLYTDGLAQNPEAIDGHKALREISFRRKAAGGKAMGMLEAMKHRRGKDDVQNLVNAEKLLAYDPGNTDHMLNLMQSAYSAGCFETILWIGPILLRANSDSGKPDYNKYIAIKDIYKATRQWQLAVEACTAAAMMRPEDMDLQSELKNLGAQQTMQQGRYESGGKFTDSVKDMAGQRELMEGERDVRNLSLLQQQVANAESALASSPEDPTLLMKLVELLRKTEDPEYENRAIELLSTWFERTGQFRYRRVVGQIKMAQLDRMERSMRAELQTDPSEAARKDYAEFMRDKTEEELKEYKLAVEAYPTDMTLKYEVAKRLFMLRQFGEAIPLLQQTRMDPKFRNEAAQLLGQAFLEAGFAEEAQATLQEAMEAYQLKGDERSKALNYWYARAAETNNDNASALKAYSQVAMWDFNYRDVQSRIKTLRGK